MRARSRRGQFRRPCAPSRVRPGQHRAWYAAGAAAVLTAVAITWLAWPSGPGLPGAGRTRPYLDVRACLLTGPGGISRGQAAEAWTSMESVSLASRAMVSYLPVTAVGPHARTAADVGPYLASLVQRQCRLIVTVGQPQAEAATAAAARFRQIQFIVISGPRGAQAPAGKPNVTQLTAASAARIRMTISQAITAAVRRGPVT